ncbi:hypothetical protein ABKN59_009202 [Abortiporus biennis]
MVDKPGQTTSAPSATNTPTSVFNSQKTSTQPVRNYMSPLIFLLLGFILVIPYWCRKYTPPPPPQTSRIPTFIHTVIIRDTGALTLRLEVIRRTHNVWIVAVKFKLTNRCFWYTNDKRQVEYGIRFRYSDSVMLS